MAADAGASGGAQVQYLEELEGWVLDERKVVTFRWLALVLSVTANAAKKMLYDFCQKQGERNVSATYLVMGRSRAAGGAGHMEVKLVSGEALDETRKSLSEVSSVHVYSVQPASTSQPADLSAQLWATDSEHSKEMLAGNTDAGANLRTHRLSGVHCPGIVDVPLPSAPTPPDHVKEESIFDHARDTGKGSAAAAAPVAADKPKGKAIAPMDFFAAAAIGGGKGKGKTKANAREEKGGEANKSAPGGGISSFFSKAPPSKKEGVPREELDLADPDKKTTKIKKEGESRDRGAKGADALVKVKKEGHSRGKDAEGADAPASASERDKTSCGAEVLQETVDAKCAGEGEKTKVNGPSAKKKPRLSKVVEDDDEDDEICSGRGGEVGERRKGISKFGEKKGFSEDEEEWNDGGGAGSSSGKKAAAVSAAANGGGSLRKSTTTKSPNPDKRVENGGKEGVECNTSKNRTSAPRDKKSRRREASGKGGAGDVGESSTERSEKRTKAKATASGGGGEGSANEEESKLPRGKDKAKEGVKRKGRYESDGEDPDEGKPPVSGAMDKFTARPEGTGGGVAKRTKIVLKTRTYMDGGYMKSVNEEVEVTDDEEEPLRPAHTNKTRTSPPDGKTINNGAENKAGGTDAPGVKGSGKTKKNSRAKPSGKQSSMTSFFNKA